MKILIKTNKQGKVEVFNKDTMELLTHIGRVEILISSFGRASAVIKFKDVEVDLDLDLDMNPGVDSENS